jgi:hypothetical protein
MGEITVSRDELDRPIWREVGAYKKHKNPDGTYTISYRENVDPAKLKYHKPRKVEPVEDEGTTEGEA